MKNRFLTKAFAIATAALIAVTNPIYASAQTPVTKDNFDSSRYANEYADLKAAFGNDKEMLWNHYVSYGSRENRVVYATNGDVGYLASAANTGLNENNFDATRYANDYADLKAAFGNDQKALWNHYVNYGAKENRVVYTINGNVGSLASAGAAAGTAEGTAAGSSAGASASNTGLNENSFDANRYANDYPDLKAAFGYNKDALWNHYMTFGVKEGRKVYALNAGTAAPAQQTAAPAQQTAAPVATEVTKDNFDYVRYANEYIEMYAIYGYDKDLLWARYTNSGRQAGLKAYPVGGTYVDQTAGTRQKLDLLRKLMEEVVSENPQFDFSPEAQMVLVDRLIEKLRANGFNSNDIVKAKNYQGNNCCANVLIDNIWYNADMLEAWQCRTLPEPIDFGIGTVNKTLY